MKKKILVIIICFVCFTLSACTGYNNVMYKHLSNEANYGTYEVAVEKIHVLNKETGKLEEYDETVHDESFLNRTVFFGVSGKEVCFDIREGML